MPKDMTFAQALNEARQVIVQQAGRIKSDAEKLKVQQEMLVSQGATIAEQERRISELSHDLQRQAEDLRDLNEKLNQAVIAREQSEAVINRQGEKITTLHTSVSEMERKLAEQAERISDLSREKEDLLEQLPSKEDAEALASMSALLLKKVTGAASGAKEPHKMRMAEAA